MKKIHALPIIYTLYMAVPLLMLPATFNQNLVEEYDIISKDKEVSEEEQPKEEKGTLFDRFKKSGDKDKEEEKESSLLKTSSTECP